MIDEIQEYLPLIATGIIILIIVILGVGFYGLQRYGEFKLPSIESILLGIVLMIGLAYLTQPKRR